MFAFMTALPTMMSPWTAAPQNTPPPAADAAAAPAQPADASAAPAPAAASATVAAQWVDGDHPKPADPPPEAAKPTEAEGDKLQKEADALKAQLDKAKADDDADPTKKMLAGVFNFDTDDLQEKYEAARDAATVQKGIENKTVDMAKASEAAGKLFKAMDGVGTDEKAMFNAFHGASREQVLAIKAAWKNHYQHEFGGRSIEEYIEKSNELTPDDKAQLRAEMSGDPVESTKAALLNQTGLYKSTNTEQINTALEDFGKLKPEEQQKIRADLLAKGQSLDARLEEHLGGRDLKLAKALASNDDEGADAVRHLDQAEHSGFLGLNTDHDKIYTVMTKYEDKGADAKHKLDEKYAATSDGKHIQDYIINKTLDKGAEQDVAKGIWDDNRAEGQALEAAARSKLALGKETDTSTTWARRGTSTRCSISSRRSRIPRSGRPRSTTSTRTTGAPPAWITSISRTGWPGAPTPRAPSSTTT